MRREFGKLALEFAERDRGLIEILVRFRRLKANGILDKIVHSPPAASFIAQIIRALRRLHQMHRAPRIICACAQIARNRGDILHRCRHILKHGIIDFLKNIARAAIGFNQIRLVDVPVSITFTVSDPPVYGKPRCNFPAHIKLSRLFRLEIQPRLQSIFARAL